MTSPRQSLLCLCKDPPRPWHLLLTPAIPLLGLLKDLERRVGDAADVALPTRVLQIPVL